MWSRASCLFRLLGVALVCAVAAPRCAAGDAPPQRLRVGINKSSKSFLDENGRLAGLYIDVFRTAAQRLSLEYEWVWLENRSIDRAFATREIDLHVAAADLPARRRQPIFLADPWWESPLVAVIPRNSPIRTLAGLRGRTVAVSRGSEGFWDTFFPQAVPGARRLDIALPGNAIEALCEGRADAALVVGPDAENMLAVHPPACREVGFRFLRAAMTHVRYSVAAQPDLRSVAERINAEILEMAAEGTLTQVVSPWQGLGSGTAEGLAQRLLARRRLLQTLTGAALLLALLLGLLLWRERRALRDVRLLHERTAALRQAEDRFRSLFDSPLAAVFTVEMPGGAIVAANPAFQRLVGPARSSLNWYDLAGDAGALDAFRGNPHQAPLRQELRCADGATVPVLLVASYLERGNGRAEALVVALDATPERQVKELTGQVLSAEDNERRRIARELHDSTAQKMASLIMMLDLAQARPGSWPEARALAGDILDELRSFSYLLHPPFLDELGLAVAMRTYLEGFQSRSGIAVDARLPEGLAPLPPDTSLALFRILQEALSNVQRHSHSKWVAVQLLAAGGQLRLTVRDGGPAQDPGQRTPGVGIRSMRERARHLGGWLEVRFGATGTLVRAVLPL